MGASETRLGRGGDHAISSIRAQRCAKAKGAEHGDISVKWVVLSAFAGGMTVLIAKKNCYEDYGGEK
jgi:hypothetical protein